MADSAQRSGGNGFLYFIVGALVVAVAVIAWIALANNGGDTAELEVNLPDVETPDVDAPDLPDAPDLEVDIDPGN